MIKIKMIVHIIIDYQNCNDHAHYKRWSKIVMIMPIINDYQNCNDHAHYNRWSKL